MKEIKDKYIPEIGDEIKFGKFKNKKAIVTGFGTDKNNQPTIVTNKGEIALYHFRLSKFMNEEKNMSNFKKYLESTNQITNSEKKHFVDIIDSLFPIDSEFKKTNDIGKKLLIDSIIENDWRNLPIEILKTYAEKCEEEEHYRLM